MGIFILIEVFAFEIPVDSVSLLNERSFPGGTILLRRA